MASRWAPAGVDRAQQQQGSAACSVSRVATVLRARLRTQSLSYSLQAEARFSALVHCSVSVLSAPAPGWSGNQQQWHRNNPTKTLDDWFASPRKRGLTTPEAQRRAAEQSAQTLGVDVEDWLALTKPEQNAFRIWWLRRKGSIAEWKAKRRGPNKKSGSN